MANTQQDQINIVSAFKPILESTKNLNRRVRDVESQEGTKLAPTVSSSDSVVANTNLPTNLYLHSIPGNALRTNQIMHGYVPFVYKNSTGAPSSLVFSLLYGGGSLLVFESVSPVNNAANRLGHLEFYLAGDGLETAQKAFGRVVIGPVLGSPTTDAFEYFALGTLSAIDSSQDQSIAITVQHGTADPNISITGKLLLITGPYTP